MAGATDEVPEGGDPTVAPGGEAGGGEPAADAGAEAPADAPPA